MGQGQLLWCNQHVLSAHAVQFLRGCKDLSTPFTFFLPLAAKQGFPFLLRGDSTSSTLEDRVRQQDRHNDALMVFEYVREL
jgi:hypothetical protein